MSRLSQMLAQDQAHRTYYEREAFKGGAVLGFVAGFGACALLVILGALVILGVR